MSASWTAALRDAVRCKTEGGTHEQADQLETRASRGSNSGDPNHRQPTRLQRCVRGADRQDGYTYPRAVGARCFRECPAKVTLVPSAGVAGSARSAARTTAVVRSRARLADRRNVARGGPPRTALGGHDRPPDPALGKLDGRLDHPLVLHATPGTSTLGGCRPDPPADDSLPPRARRLLATAHDRLKTVRDSI